ncbi:hypothetical protein K431DRAFT_153308 [Polychaeton citri CBS 116435]|uniref:Uncharacterized protein n=1 Tax=Polychaeton citri CBS 116435 TaxID=1314669 RepID=A0A9P4Q0F2_9PEZI|nr:hypothetical protein K431DRAFT_153308 [Polychaeton citri CBS 116435]
MSLYYNAFVILVSDTRSIPTTSLLTFIPIPSGVIRSGTECVPVIIILSLLLMLLVRSDKVFSEAVLSREITSDIASSNAELSERCKYDSGSRNVLPGSGCIGNPTPETRNPQEGADCHTAAKFKEEAYTRSCSRHSLSNKGLAGKYLIWRQDSRIELIFGNAVYVIEELQLASK